MRCGNIDVLSAKVIIVKERINRHRKRVPPDGRDDEHILILAHVNMARGEFRTRIRLGFIPCRAISHRLIIERVVVSLHGDTQCVSVRTAGYEQGKVLCSTIVVAILTNLVVSAGCSVLPLVLLLVFSSLPSELEQASIVMATIPARKQSDNTVFFIFRIYWFEFCCKINGILLASIYNYFPRFYLFRRKEPLTNSPNIII